jgi:hypothetical protein
MLTSNSAMSVSGVKMIIKYVIVSAVLPKVENEGQACKTSNGSVEYE